MLEKAWEFIEKQCRLGKNVDYNLRQQWACFLCYDPVCEEPSKNIEHSSVGRQSLNPKEILVISMCKDQIIFKFIIYLRFYFPKIRENREAERIT